MAKHGRGLICAPIAEVAASGPAPAAHNTRSTYRYRVRRRPRHNTRIGLDRAGQSAMSTPTKPSDFRRPAMSSHCRQWRAVLRRAGHTEAAASARLAVFNPSAVS